MAHLASFRHGWQSENLARFLLSKFAFISHPASISDDIGSDFFCTLFKTVREESRDYLVPKNSFAIQIKSDSSTFAVSNKIDYLDNLEVPFFVGVVDKADFSLSIYSGEAVPFFFSHHGRPEFLQIELSEYPIQEPLELYTPTNTPHVP